MNIKRIATVMGLAQATWLSGCGDTDDGGSGNCGKVMPCGGDIVGDWKLSNVCVDTTNSGDFTEGACPTATLTTTPKVSGSINYSANATYTSNQTTSGSVKVTLPESCLTQGGFLLTCAQIQTFLGPQLAEGGLEGTKCTDASGGCACTASITPQTTSETGTYTASGTKVTHTPANGVPDESDYCVQGNALHLISLDPADNTKILGDIVATR